ncbi:MAG: mannose-1-phosphate guanylyltransferase, partial [Muribaculaceae bacterium]|nr:mannose-1-phosphate guanylyltransferase [Muribaculaceae bacterium]
MQDRFCVIMCGGVGSRFWPYSREAMPKQFIDFLGIGRSLLQLTFDRIADIVPHENIFLLTNEQYAGIIQEQLPVIKSNQILLEPMRRNTAPCNAWAAWHIKAINPNAKIMVAPSDHLILKQQDFKECVIRAFDFIDGNDAIVTFGVKPSRPETGYGYIQEEQPIDEFFSKVKTFTEKPNKELANLFLE